MEGHHQEGRHRARIGTVAIDANIVATRWRRGLRGRPPRCGRGVSRAHGALDYLVLECLAERTIALAQLRRRRDPASGYDARLTERVESLLPMLKEKGVRLVSNFGAANPLARGRCDRRDRAPACAFRSRSRRSPATTCSARSTSTRRRWRAACRCRVTRRSCPPTRTSARRRCCLRSRAARTSSSRAASPIHRCSWRR